MITIVINTIFRIKMLNIMMKKSFKKNGFKRIRIIRMIMSFCPLNRLMILTISIIAKVNLSDMQQNMLSLTFIDHCVDTSKQESSVFFVYWVVIMLYRCCTTCKDQRSHLKHQRVFTFGDTNISTDNINGSIPDCRSMNHTFVHSILSTSPSASVLTLNLDIRIL